MSILVALDPSLNSSGLAIFRDALLIYAARVTLKRSTACVAQRARDMACVLAACVYNIGAETAMLVSEFPQIYRAGKSKGDPNDQLGMAAVVGALAALLGCPVTTYAPRWMTLKKSLLSGEAFSSPRGQRVMSRLTEAERALVPNSNDAVDAVGVGLFHLGRLNIKRVLAGAV